MYWYQDVHTQPISPYPYCHLTWKQLPRYRYPEGFDAKRYYRLNQPCLDREEWAKKDPALHYALYGEKEGRRAI
tara:strand:+ start:56 stop:277 length:222 start_codon:yes stop_codon:yes gene_type:complete